MINREYVKRKIEIIESKVQDFMMSYPNCELDCWKRFFPYTLFIIPFELACFIDALYIISDLSVGIIIFSIIGMPIAGLIMNKRLRINRDTSEITNMLNQLIAETNHDKSVEKYSDLIQKNIDSKLEKARKWRKRSIIIPLSLLGILALVIAYIYSFDNRGNASKNMEIEEMTGVSNNSSFEILNIDDSTSNAKVYYEDNKKLERHSLRIDSLNIGEDLRDKTLRLCILYIVRDDTLINPYMPKFVFETNDQPYVKDIRSEDYTTDYQVLKMLESFGDKLFYKIETVNE